MTSPPRSQRTFRPRAARVVVDRPARADGKHTSTGRVRDLSTAGAFVACERLPALGERLTLRFTVPARAAPLDEPLVSGPAERSRERLAPGHDVVVEAQGEVAHRRTTGERGVGVRFVRLSHESARAIQRFVDALLAGAPRTAG